MSLPLLSLLLFMPLAGIASIWLLPVRATRHVVALAMLLPTVMAQIAS